MKRWSVSFMKVHKPTVPEVYEDASKSEGQHAQYKV